MAEQVIDINELTQDQHNFNKGTAKGKKLMNKSLKELGAGRSILLDKNGNIIMTAAGKYLAQAGDSENIALVSFIRGWKKRFAEVSEILQNIEQANNG